MSERDKRLLVYLGALIILAAAYFLVGKPFLDKIDALDTEKMSLQSELSEKQRAFNMRPEYQNRIAEAEDEMNKIIAKFPEDIVAEKSIMFAYNAERDIPMNFNQLSFAETVDSIVNDAGSQSASEAEAGATEAAVAANDDEEATASAENAIPNGENSVDLATGVSGLTGRNTQLGMSYSVGYQGFKDYLTFIRDYDERLIVTEIDATYDFESNLVTGSLVLSQYALLGPDRQLPEINTGKEEMLGKGNVFAKGTSNNDVNSVLESLMSNLESEDNEDLNRDYVIMIDASTENTNAVTVGKAHDVEGETYLTSSKNGENEIYFSVSGENGEYIAEYSVDGKSYEHEFEKNDESIVLQIQSSYRIDENDDVTAKVHVTNDTDVDMIVQITGEDSDNPRVDIVEKNGSIEIR